MQVLQRLAETQDSKTLKHYGAFYSSELGGIVTQPGYMVVHMDDHIVHQGDAVHDAGVLLLALQAAAAGRHKQPARAAVWGCVLKPLLLHACSPCLPASMPLHL